MILIGIPRVRIVDPFIGYELLFVELEDILLPMERMRNTSITDLSLITVIDLEEVLVELKVSLGVVELRPDPSVFPTSDMVNEGPTSFVGVKVALSQVSLDVVLAGFDGVIVVEDSLAVLEARVLRDVTCPSVELEVVSLIVTTKVETCSRFDIGDLV